MLHVGALVPLHLQDGAHLMGQLGSSLIVVRLIGRLKCLVDGVRDFILMEGDHPAVPLTNLL